VLLGLHLAFVLLGLARVPHPRDRLDLLGRASKRRTAAAPTLALRFTFPPAPQRVDSRGHVCAGGQAPRAAGAAHHIKI
jgi:hypothetical protein